MTKEISTDAELISRLLTTRPTPAECLVAAARIEQLANAALEPVTPAPHVNETPKTEHDAGNVLTPAPDAAAIRKAALRRTLRELITEQSEGEWDDETINKDVETFLPRILALLTEKPHDRA